MKRNRRKFRAKFKAKVTLDAPVAEAFGIER